MNLEAAALDGSLFRPTVSGRRESMSSDDNLDDNGEKPSAARGTAQPSFDNRRGAKTGPKGVLGDHAAYQAEARLAGKERTSALKAEQDSRAIIAPTLNEEDEVSRWRHKRIEEMRYASGLREVGQEGFVAAVERDGWVCVLIYEPNIERCVPLLLEATSIARSSDIAIVRARASVIGFGVGGCGLGGGIVATVDPHGSDSEEEGEKKPRADPDILPTLLVYRDGLLEHNLVRVDFEVGPDGLEGLLRREGVIEH